MLRRHLRRISVAGAAIMEATAVMGGTAGGKLVSQGFDPNLRFDDAADFAVVEFVLRRECN